MRINRITKEKVQDAHSNETLEGNVFNHDNANHRFFFSLSSSDVKYEFLRKRLVLVLIKQSVP